jgi:CRISPR/Cas system CMR-associated protein Cmr5 small subunit
MANNNIISNIDQANTIINNNLHSSTKATYGRKEQHFSDWIIEKHAEFCVGP